MANRSNFYKNRKSQIQTPDLKNKYLFALMDNSTGRKSFPKVFCFQLFTETLVKIVILGEGERHNSKIAFPDYRSIGLNLYARKCNGNSHSRDNHNRLGFLG